MNGKGNSAYKGSSIVFSHTVDTTPLFDDDGGGGYWDDADCIMMPTTLVLEVILNGSEDRDSALTWRMGGILIRCPDKCIPKRRRGRRKGAQG